MELKFVPGRGRAALPWGSNRTFMELKFDVEQVELTTSLEF